MKPDTVLSDGRAAGGDLPPARPEGWKLVPLEPTEEMTHAAAQTPGIKRLDNMAAITQLRTGDFRTIDFGRGSSGRTLDWGECDGSPLEQAWRAMLDAAPEAPAFWEPQFDAISVEQERLVLQFCAEIAGPRGQKGSPPDPVRLLEMAQALYQAERDARP